MPTKNLNLKLPTMEDQVMDTINSLSENFQAIDDKVATVTKSNINLINEDVITPGMVPSITTGELQEFSNYSASDFIPVTPGKYYRQNEGSFKVFYNASKVFISGVNAEMALAPANAAFIRVAISDAQIPGKTMLVEGTVLPPYENFHTKTLSNDIKLYHPLANQKWCVMGDSITQGFGSTPYTSYIFDRTGILVENYGISGSWLSNAPGATDPMCVRYSGMSNDAEIITVFGGTNDASGGAPIGAWGDATNATVYGAMKILVEGLLTKYPGKRIGFILTTPREGYTGTTNAVINVNNAIKDVCNRYSIPTLDLYNGSGLAPNFAASKTAVIPDGLHPNSTGQKLISYKIQDFLQRI